MKTLIKHVKDKKFCVPEEKTDGRRKRKYSRLERALMKERHKVSDYMYCGGISVFIRLHNRMTDFLVNPVNSLICVLFLGL